MKKKANIICSFMLSLALLVGLFPAMPVHAAGSYSGAPQNLSVPPLAFDESKIVLTWEKPDDYYESTVKIVDYEVFRDGSRLGLASDNFKENYSYVNAYKDAFYGKLSTQHHQISILSFTATGLAPKTNYEFKVRAVYADHSTSAFSAPRIFSTASTPIVIDAAGHGATYITDQSGSYTTRRANNNATVIKEIADNTATIQAAIDATPVGGKVVLKGSGNNAAPRYYTSGSLFLHSNMTFEIEEGAVLLGSPVFDHYPRSLLVYPYSQDIRTYGLLNAVSWDNGSLENIRIVGKGAIDGNGWKKTTGSGLQNKTAVDPSPGFDDPTGNGWSLPNYQGGSNTTVDNNSASDSAAVRGILAADAMWQSRQDQTPNAGASQFYNARPNLTVARGVHGLYYEGLTFYNPAFHGIVNYQSEQIAVNGVVTMMFDANNGDGVEFGDCLDLTVMNSFWDTGDDAINFAAGQGTVVRNLTDKVASGEGRVFNNFVRNGHGGLLAMGSHTGGWIGDLVAEENVYNTSEAGSNGVLRMKSGATTGGGIRNIVVRDNAANYMLGGNSTIVIDTSYSDANSSTAFGPESEQPLTFENVQVRNMTVSNSIVPLINNTTTYGSSAYAKSPVLRNFTFEDIKILSYSGASGGTIAINGLSDVTFRNITGLQKAITTTNSKNVTIENSVGTTNRKPDVLNGSGALSVTANTYNVTLNWSAINNATQYVVLVDMLDGHGYQQKKIVMSTGAGSESTEIALRPSTSYKVAVRPETVGANASYGKLLETTVTTGAATLGASTISTASPDFKVKAANITGISWQDFAWNAVTDAVYGVHYYELTATPKNPKYATKIYKAYFESSSRQGYSLWGLDDGVTYDVTMKAVNWIGQKGTQWGPVIITTVPGTLMQIPTWAPGSKLTVSGSRWIGEDMIITWNEKDVTDYSNGDTARFAGYRILINGVPVDGGATQANAKPTVKPGQNTYVLSTAGLLPNVPYTISVEAGSEILKYASGAGGLGGSTGFTGTKNTDLPRNQVTFGKWTGHGPSVTHSFLSGPASDASVTNVTVAGVTATVSGSDNTVYNGVLPYDKVLANLTASDIVVTTTDVNTTVGTATTSDGGKTWKVVVTAEDNATKVTYTINVTVGASPNASLSTLSLSGITLSPAVSSNVYAYTATVPNEVSVTTAAYAAVDSHATVALLLNGSPVKNPISLNVGSNMISVVVTAQDGTTTKTYTVTVTRSAPAIPIVPIAPTGLTVVAGDGQALLNWNGVSEATSYKVYKGTATGIYDAAPVAIVSKGTSSNVTGLTNGTTYYFTVRASNESGDSPYAAEVSGTPMKAPVTAPSLTSLALTPPTFYLQAGSSATMAATATYSDNSTREVTDELIWTFSTSGVASISKGVVSAMGVGTTVATATYGNQTAQLNITVVTYRSSSRGRGSSPTTGTTPTTTTTPDNPTPAPLTKPEPSPFVSSVVTSVEKLISKIKETLEANKDAKVTFTDTSSHWGAKDIAMASRLHIIEGYLDGSFKPNASVTRAEFSVMITRAFGLTAASDSNKTSFRDIDKDNWAKSYIEILTSSGIVNGYEDGTFQPNKNISRAEMLTIISRILNLKELSKNGSVSLFADVNSGYWAKETIEKAIGAGIIQGVSTDTFAPDHNATRAEALTLIIRSLKTDTIINELLK
ncbi:S-layer homology domain-containing protein [Paenibacillus foliorum]|nr:S-layer homology domain-containing protein [Paenibacillus foliorum]